MAIRKPDQTLKQNINNGSQVNHMCTSGKRVLKMRTIRTCPLGDVQAEDRATPPLSRREKARRREAAKMAGAKAFAAAVGAMAHAHGGMWEGAWRQLLAAVTKPAGCKAWPMSSSGVLDYIYRGREELQRT